jgi:hypothetical protein
MSSVVYAFCAVWLCMDAEYHAFVDRYMRIGSCEI